MTDRRATGVHDIVPFPPERNATLDTLRHARRRFDIPILLEVDMTAARRAIRDYRNQTGEGLSLTAWVVHCVARAAAEHPEVHALRQGSRRLVRFREVDVAVIIERALRATEPAPDPGAGLRSAGASRPPRRPETVPMPYVIRGANGKGAPEIHAEIRRAQTTPVGAGATAIDTGPPPWAQALFFRLPAWLRDLAFWRPLLRSPRRFQRLMGTVAVTSPGMTLPGVLAWGIPRSLHPLAIAVGGIARRNAGQGEAAEILALSIVFDHAVTDGAPAGRFVARLHQLLTHPRLP